MNVLDKLNEYAAKVNELTNAEAASIETIVAWINEQKAKLVDAVTPEQVAAILDPPLANLTAVSETLKTVAAGNQPSVPDPTPTPDQPPL